MDFRDPVVVDTLLQSTHNYNVFFVCSHGSLSDNTDSSFRPEPNTILIYTGAGKAGFPIWTDDDDERAFMNLFDTKNIKQTFASLLGLYDDHADLLYKVPSDILSSPQINLSIDEDDIALKTGFWGVYKHTGGSAGRRAFSNIEKVDTFTAALMEGTTASEMMKMINAEYKSQGKTNIIMFISCRTAQKDGTRLSDYSDSASIFLTPSHFMFQYKPSGLNKHVPHEKNKQKRIYFIYHDYVIPLDPEERNQTVKELLAYLREKYGLFDIFKHVKTITIVGDRVRTLQSDVLFESQWDESMIRIKNGMETIFIFPEFKEKKGENILYKFNNNSDYYDPEHIESTVVRRRWASVKARKSTKSTKTKTNRNHVRDTRKRGTHKT